MAAIVVMGISYLALLLLRDNAGWAANALLIGLLIGAIANAWKTQRRDKKRRKPVDMERARRSGIDVSNLLLLTSCLGADVRHLVPASAAPLDRG